MNQLAVTIHTTNVQVSPRDQFLVPVGNRYSLHNQSSTENILLHFVLVKSANTWMREFQAQTEQAARLALEAHERNQAEEEQDEREQRLQRRQQQYDDEDDEEHSAEDSEQQDEEAEDARRFRAQQQKKKKQQQQQGKTKHAARRH